MLTAGIIAEYNPFHNGHKYQIEKTRQSGATHIAAVMSGDCVQRGEPALFSKYERAKAAIENGVDLVIELPCPFSCSNGEVFAKSAVQIFAGLGENVINVLSFGCECSDKDKLVKAAEISSELKESLCVKNYLAAGMNYPAALQKAAAELYNKSESELFSSPNNMLAIEYIKALEQYAKWIEPLPIKRYGAEHDSHVHTQNFASATALREMIKNSKDYSEFSPYKFSGKYSDMKNIDKALLFKIFTSSKEDILELPDSSEEIANRFIKAKYSHHKNVSDFMQEMKSKNFTMARIRRLVMHLAIGVKSRDIMPVPYGRILAFNKRGSEILAKAKNSPLPFDTSLKRLESINPFAKRISFLEQNAVYLREMSGGEEFSNEYIRKIVIT